ncbi:MAG: ATP-binding protein, partial [Gaiellales bacterium]
TDLRTMEGFISEYNESFQYEFVGVHELHEDERRIFDRASEILELVGISESTAPPIRISSTMRVGLDTTDGVWDNELGSIVIKRDQLRSLADFAGTLLHEAAHATTGAVDVTRQFEGVLTDYLGQTSDRALR